MSDDKLYQVLLIDGDKIQETFEFISLSDFKKKYPRYYYSENCLHKPNYLEILSLLPIGKKVMIQIYSSLGELNA